MRTARVPVVAAPPMDPLPFYATVVFHRGHSCQHSDDRQCDPCFHAYPVFTLGPKRSLTQRV
jgi:hypothetical protein